ncbi:glycosyltransferase family 4 protein [Agrobacterium rosae]|uniref:D-inositol 3-phosphate glycosyltransferase n=1 Tax=Agrobacterium rosae TaxID=1972867 RepID=A0A1R3TFP5_9HYPH|nr:glycosyltransferase family 4 protein [Agrobacterium rosae]SCX05026.1 D-inositol 3-phosphate glycosyltransferase [Agrobacterium rosae]
MPYIDLANVRVLAPNFKRRLSGVTSTIIQLLPVQNRQGQDVAAIGPGLPDSLPHVRFRDLWQLWKLGPDHKPRAWHARRNIEMLPGIVMRDILRMKLKLVFTSASQRKHSGWTKFLISRMDAVIATNGKTATYLDVPSTVIMHGIDTERFSPAVDKAASRRLLGLDAHQKYAGCFGRVRHQKGTDLFVDTMIAVLPQRPEWSAIIAGRATGPHVEFENGLKDKVRAAGLANRILFVGEHTNINDWYRTLDLFVAPQRWEGFGLTPLEAMATGVPVVATDVGAFPELIAEPQTGEIISRDDLDAMVRTVAMWMEDAAKRDHASGLARSHVTENFTINGEADNIGKVYAALTASA